MKSIQKAITLIIWCISVAITFLSFVNGFDNKVKTYLCLTMFSVCICTTILYFLPIRERIKSVLVLVMTGGATLGVSVLLGGNGGTFISSFIVLGVALLYFDPFVLVAYSAIYLPLCLIAYLVNPVYLIGNRTQPYMGVVMLFAYACMTVCLYIGTKFGNKYLQSAIDDRKDAQEKSEVVERQSKVAQQNSELIYQKIEQSRNTVSELTNEANKENQNMQQLKEAELATLELFHGLKREISDTTAWIEENYELINALQENYAAAMENVEESKQYSDSAQSSMQEIATAIQHAHACIEKSSKETEKIAAIIQDINAITSQTNLLAINASIEAARVSNGEIGFEIVAEQIRTLSTQSKQAAENISGILTVLSQVLGVTNNKISQGKAAIHRGIGNLDLMVEGIDTINHYSNQSQETLRQEINAFEKINQEFTKMVMQVEDSMATAKQEMEDLEVAAEAISSQTNRTEQFSGYLRNMEALADRLTSQFTA